jgi:hypothetical protein
MARKILLAVVSLAALAQLGCGGSSSSPPPPPPPHTSATVPAATGGTVALSGGAAVQIPAGALATDTTITIQQSTITAPTSTVGAVYDLGPSGTTFSQPVTVTIPVPAGTTDAAIWTKPAGTAHYTSLPTTVSGGVATAQATHFSVFLVGPVDLNGTWAGLVAYSYANPNGTSGTGSTMQAREVTQDVGDVTLSIGSGNGLTATCTGTVTGAVLSTDCTLLNLDGSCTSHYQQSGTVSGDTWYLDTTYQWTGATCQSAGQTIQLLHSPVTRRTGPGRNIAGSYVRTSSYTETGPGKNPYTGSNTGTAARTQVPGSSLVRNDVTMTNGTTHTCKGIVISDVGYSSCYGFNVDRTIRYNSVAQGTITAGPPIDVDSISTTTIIGDPNGYTSMTSIIHDVQQ